MLDAYNLIRVLSCRAFLKAGSLHATQGSVKRLYFQSTGRVPNVQPRIDRVLCSCYLLT